MSRTHYREVAEIIKRQRELAPPTQAGYAVAGVLANVASELADFFKRDNSRFDRAKFMEACGL